MTKKPLISIGMPVYNGEKHINQAIQSILAQTERNFRLIISDNCSTDQTLEICQHYARIDERVSVTSSERNEGPIYNFLNVVKNVNTPYFMWAAHDDVWSEDWIEKLLCLHDDSTALTFGSVINISEDGTELGTYTPKNFRRNSKRSQIEFFLEEDTEGKANLIYGIYKTEHVVNLAPRAFGELEFADDMLFVFLILQYGDILIAETPKLYKRVTPRVWYWSDLRKIVSRLLMLERMKTYYYYFKRVNNKNLKIVFLILLPIKYFMSLYINFRILGLRLLSLMKNLFLRTLRISN